MTKTYDKGVMEASRMRVKEAATVVALNAGFSLPNCDRRFAAALIEKVSVE